MNDIELRTLHRVSSEWRSPSPSGASITHAPSLHADLSKDEDDVSGKDVTQSGSRRTSGAPEDISGFGLVGRDTEGDGGSLAPSRHTLELEVGPVPEGGYGWVICAACGTITFFCIGNTYAWGVMQAALVNAGLAPSSTLSFIQGLATSCIAFFAIVNARLVRRLGARNSGIVGCLLFSSGQILSGFAVNNVGGLFVTAGVMMGVGLSLLFMVISIMPAQYFAKRRGLANGIIYSCGGFGGAALSYMQDALARKFGPGWTFRINGFITLGVMLPMMLLLKERNVATRAPVWPQWRLFRDAKFLPLFLTGAIGTFPLLVPAFFLPLYAQSLGLTSTDGASLLAGYNIASAFGRLGFGQLADIIGPINTLFITIVIGAISMLAIWPFSTTLAPLIVFTILNGMANGGFFSMMPTVVGSVFGAAQIAVAMGMVVSGWAGGYLMGAPIAGYLLNAYGGTAAGLSAYRPAMYYAGSLALASGGLVLILRSRISTDIFKVV